MRMEGTYRCLLLMAVVTVLALVGDHVTQADPETRPDIKNIEKKRTGGMDPNLFRAYLDLHQRPATTTESVPSWHHFVPPVPEENEIECYVEVVRVRRRGGRCVQLGGNRSRPYVCQRGQHVEFQEDCERIVQQRILQQQINDYL